MTRPARKPRINVMIMTEGETDRPVRSFTLPWYAPRLAIWVGMTIAFWILISGVLLIYFGNRAGRIGPLETRVDGLRRTVKKVELLETELAYHRHFTRKVAGLIGISVPAFADSAEMALATMAESASGQTDSGTSPTAGDLRDSRETGAPGVLVTDCEPDPNNRPRGLPLPARISRGFSPHEGNPALHHLGIDFAIREGVPVLATAAGLVEYASPDDLYGLLIVLDHQNGFKTTYGHNSVILVRTGESVARGDRIAFSGNTGVSTAAHLHYQITRDGKPVDPTGFLGR